MDPERFVVSDTVWEKIEALLPGKKSDRGVTAKDNRLFLEAVLWRARAGLPWRDRPAEFGHWNSVEFIPICNLSRFCHTDPLTGGISYGWSTVR